ncbi:LOW QUALITY PROTEIN: hypothetical protein V2J09_011378 [Rumex salicifolius]
MGKRARSRSIEKATPPTPPAVDRWTPEKTAIQAARGMLIYQSHLEQVVRTGHLQMDKPSESSSNHHNTLDRLPSQFLTVSPLSPALIMLTQALKSSGVDLSQATISVQEFTNNNDNRTLKHERVKNIRVEDSNQAVKRLKTVKS